MNGVRTRWLAVPLLLALVGLAAASCDDGGEKESQAAPSASTPIGVQGDVETEKFGPPELPFTMDGDTKVFELTAAPTNWRPRQDLPEVEAWAYNGQVPGPTIRVLAGDKFRLVFRNDLPEHSSIHWHGLIVPNNMDGVGGLTQDPVNPGQSFTYEFTIPTTPGTFMYHAHMNDLMQVRMGLYGAFIVEGEGEPKFDQDRIVLLSDLGGEFMVNGGSFPDTEAWEVESGQHVRVRLINISSVASHPMHFHGHFMRLIARDGTLISNGGQVLVENTISMDPGQTADVEVVMNSDPGTWIFHCHVLNHVMGPEPESADVTKANGGMVIAVAYGDGSSSRSEGAAPATARQLIEQAGAAVPVEAAQHH